MSDCLFCKIVRGEIPCKKVYEDEHMLAFHDINPWAPVHVLVVPKTSITITRTISQCQILNEPIPLSSMHQLGRRGIAADRNVEVKIIHLLPAHTSAVDDGPKLAPQP